MKKRVSIQGYEGCFHQEAAEKYFGNTIEVIPCANFRELVKIAGNPLHSDGGVMAIENSIAGSILPNYNLLQKSKLNIIGEVYLQIHQHLMVCPDTSFEDIREVHSHPMALLQCTDFLDTHHWKLVESEDTALSAKKISGEKNKTTAAIASKTAARLFGLKLLAENIENEKNNYTRFLILSNEVPSVENANKATIHFHTTHKKGSLAKVLDAIAEGDINLSKLQSFPIAASEWKYSFHADMEFENPEVFQMVISELKDLTEMIRVYGVYRRGVK